MILWYEHLCVLMSQVNIWINDIDSFMIFGPTFESPPPPELILGSLLSHKFSNFSPIGCGAAKRLAWAFFYFVVINPCVLIWALYCFMNFLRLPAPQATATALGATVADDGSLALENGTVIPAAAIMMVAQVGGAGTFCKFTVTEISLVRSKLGQD